MNCGVALTPSLSVSSSTILPIENHRADLRRCKNSLAIFGAHFQRRLTSSNASSSLSAMTWVNRVVDDDDLVFQLAVISCKQVPRSTVF